MYTYICTHWSFSTDPMYICTHLYYNTIAIAGVTLETTYLSDRPISSFQERLRSMQLHVGPSTESENSTVSLSLSLSPSLSLLLHSRLNVIFFGTED